MGAELQVLEGARDAEPDDAVRRLAQQVLPLVADRAPASLLEARDDVERRRLAGAVRADRPAIWSFSTVSESSSRARMPPKRRLTLSTSSSATAAASHTRAIFGRGLLPGVLACFGEHADRLEQRHVVERLLEERDAVLTSSDGRRSRPSTERKSGLRSSGRAAFSTSDELRPRHLRHDDVGDEDVDCPGARAARSIASSGRDVVRTR